MLSKKKISTSQLMKVSQNIVDIFPKENKQTYFIPSKTQFGRVTPTNIA